MKIDQENFRLPPRDAKEADHGDLFTVGENGRIVEIAGTPYWGSPGEGEIERWLVTVHAVPGRTWSTVLRVECDALYPLKLEWASRYESEVRSLSEAIGQFVRDVRSGVAQ